MCHLHTHIYEDRSPFSCRCKPLTKLKGMQVKSLKCGSKGEKRHPDGNYDLRVRCESGDNVD